MNAFLAIFLLVLFFGGDFPSWNQLKTQRGPYLLRLRNFLNKESPAHYSFIFVIFCFAGFSLWESLIYFLIDKNLFELPRALMGSALFLWALILKYKTKTRGNTPYYLCFLGWLVLMGSWISGILFGPWLYYRWKIYQKSLENKG